MAEIVAAAPTSHAPLITGKPDVSRPDQRDRLYAGSREIQQRLAAAVPDVLVVFANDHVQNFGYNNIPAFCDFAYSYEIESWDEMSVPLHFVLPEADVPIAPIYLHELRRAAAAHAAPLPHGGRESLPDPPRVPAPLQDLRCRPCHCEPGGVP